MADNALFNGTGPDHMMAMPLGLDACWALRISFESDRGSYVTSVTCNERTFNQALIAYIKQTGVTGYGTIISDVEAKTTSSQRYVFARVLAKDFLSCLHLVLSEHPEDAADYAHYYHSHSVPCSLPYSTLTQKKVCAFIMHSGFWRSVREFALTNWIPSGPGIDSDNENYGR